MEDCSVWFSDNISSYRDEFETGLKHQKNFVSDSILDLFFDSRPPKVPPRGSDPNAPEERLPDLPPPPAGLVQTSSTPPAPPPPGERDKAELKDREKLQRSTEAAKEEAPAEGSPRRRKELSSERGADAWRSWIEWRGAQSHLGHVSCTTSFSSSSLRRPAQLNDSRNLLTKLKLSF